VEEWQSPQKGSEWRFTVQLTAHGDELMSSYLADLRDGEMTRKQMTLQPYPVRTQLSTGGVARAIYAINTLL
jgi:hypothetical protein